MIKGWVEVFTPEPASKHNACQACSKRFHKGTYKEHIRSQGHAQVVSAQNRIWNQIDMMIDQMNQNCQEKNKQQTSLSHLLKIRAQKFGSERKSISLLKQADVSKELR